MKDSNEIKIAQKLIRCKSIAPNADSALKVVEGIIVGEGSVLSMGMYIGQSTKIVNRASGEIIYGKIPPYSVVVPGTLPDKNNPSAPSLYCVVIIKQVDEKTRSKTSINDLLRE